MTESSPSRELVRAYESLVVERAGAVALFRLNRPDVMNAISSGMVDDLNSALDLVSPWARTLVIGGSEFAFSAGGDLMETRRLFAQSRDSVRRFYGSIDAALSRIAELPVPTVAAVRGYAIAGGLEIALSCDLVVAADDATFGDGHARYGLVPGGGSCSRLTRAVGGPRAKQLLLTGKSVDARTAHEWGLVTELAPSEEVEARALGLAAELSLLSRQGLAAMKTVVNDALDVPLADSLAREQMLCVAQLDCLDYEEGLNAFAERRVPNFPGHAAASGPLTRSTSAGHLATPTGVQH